MKPVVSIVGRPNVGKSTLFNRIIRKREAIVDDEPGITRDRKTADANWEGVNFTLVDTGGYIPRTRDIIEAGVTKQVRLAMEEADLIVFLADVTTGITNVDGEVARLLRKSGKPCVVAVNKVDTARREPEAAAFIQLGLGEPVTISAMRGLGIGDLLSIIIERLGPMETAEEDYPEDTVKLAVVGKPNVGKSTFVNCILGEERVLVTEIPGTTRDAVDVRFQYEGRDMVLIDTAGIRRRTKVKESVEYYSSLRTQHVIERCDVAAVFVDAAEGLTQQDMRVLRMVVEARKGVLLVLNKWDLLKGDAMGQQSIELNLDLKMQGLQFIPVISISSLTRLRVKNALRSVLTIFEERRKRVGSPALNRLIEAFGRQYQHPSVQGKRIRIMYGSQVSTAPPKFTFFANHPELIRENYMRYIENQLREHFGFEGVPIVMSFRKK